jgi:hypothetical protein
MKGLLSLIYVMFLSNLLVAQELHLGVGFIVGEQNYNSTVIDLDSIVVYQNNLYSGYQLNPPSIRLELSLSKKVHVALGLQYRTNFFNLGTYRRVSEPLGPAAKGTVVSLPTLEIPMSAFYDVFSSKNVHLRVYGGAMAAYNGIRFHANHKGDPQSLDFTPSVAHVLNQAGTVPKRSYTNYFYGINIQYKRFGFEIYRVNTLSRTMNKSFKIWGTEHTFNRRSKSLRLTLTYKIWKRKKE